MKPFFMLDKGLFQPPNPTEVKETDSGVGTVEDVTGEYQKQRRSDDEVIISMSSRSRLPFFQ